MSLESGPRPRGHEEQLPRPGGRGWRVLVVEDDRAVRDALARSLRSAGLHVSTAGSVAEGLRLGEEHDWLVLDIELGDGSGVELAERLLARRCGQRIVFLTACSDWRTLSRAAELGSVLRKPTGIRELLRELEIPAALPMVSV